MQLRVFCIVPAMKMFVWWGSGGLVLDGGGGTDSCDSSIRWVLLLGVYGVVMGMCTVVAC